MEGTRKKLKISDQEAIIGVVLHYKSLHEQIAELELKMMAMTEKKDELLKDLLDSRANEQFLMSRLSFDYGGEGKIDTMAMEWVITVDNIKTEEHENN